MLVGYFRNENEVYDAYNLYALANGFGSHEGKQQNLKRIKKLYRDSISITKKAIKNVTTD